MTPVNKCLDGETLAAWVDGGLNRSDAAMAEAHVSSCPRCQEIVGLIVKTTPVAVVHVPWWRRRAAWLVPVTAGVTAAGLLMIARPDPAPNPSPAPAAATRESVRDAAAPTVPPAAPPVAARAETKTTAPRPAETKKERQREERANTEITAAPAAAAPPAAALGRLADEQSARQTFAKTAAKQAVSPDGALHWRITDHGALERSTDGGTTWRAVTVGITATFTTVQAPEPRTAIVTTTDGRQFRTADAGATWQPVLK